MSKDGKGGRIKFELWNANRRRAIQCKRGQAFLRELLEALDALPKKLLIRGTLNMGGEVCALGAVGLKRGIDMTVIDSRNHRKVAEIFGISAMLAREIAYWNDLGVDACFVGSTDNGEFSEATADKRFRIVRAWVVAQLGGDGYRDHVFAAEQQSPTEHAE